MRSIFFFLIISGLVRAESYSSGFTISGDGLVINNSPVKVQRNSNGDLRTNFSVMKMLSGAGDSETNLPVRPTVVIPPKTDVLTDSDTFFRGVGEKRN